ncbi:MAG: hypothetical protein AB7G17_03655 [Phycisphaerales bacterium]
MSHRTQAELAWTKAEQGVDARERSVVVIASTSQGCFDRRLVTRRSW